MKTGTLLGRTAAVTGGALALMLPLMGPVGTANAETGTEIVSESDVVRQAEDTPPTNDWVLYTRAGTPPTAAAFVDAPGDTPLGTGSLQLTTATVGEKVQLFNYDHVGTPLADVDDIAYSTYRTAGSADQLAALNVQVDYNGAADGGFTTLVFEPVYNLGQQAVVNGTWQQWAGTGSAVWWSTRPINEQCAGATAACDQTWDEFVANNPDAVIVGVGVNQGSGNAGLTTNVDAFTFDETTYDFELVGDTDGDGDGDGDDPITKDDCKDGGWMNFTPAYKNQGQCVSFYSKR